MAFLTETEKRRVAEAIGQAEAKTGGELVAVIARAADSYLFIPTLWAAVIALLVPPALLAQEYLPLGAWGGPALQPGPWQLYTAQLAVFVVLAVTFRWRPVCMRLIPRRVQRARAGRLAREQFFARGLHLTAGRTGVLLFVSVAEHHVELLADRGIDDKVPAGAWDGIVAGFTGRVKAGRVADGFVEAAAACGALLAEHAPGRRDDANELPDHLIEI